MSDQPATEIPHGDLLTLPEAAELLKRRPATLHLWMRKGLLTVAFSAPDGTPLFAKADVEALLRRGRKRMPGAFPVTARPFPVAGIALGAGGGAALIEFLRHLPTDLGVAHVVLRQDGTEALALESLKACTTLPVIAVTEGMQLEADRVYLLPQGPVFALTDGSFRMAARHARSGQGPIDHFLTSLARRHHNHAVAVLLAGTDDDGISGAKAIKAEGGLVIAQDDAGAPGDLSRGVREAGVVDLVLRPDRIGKALGAVLKQLYLREGARLPAADEEELHRILLLVQQRKGIDFRHYKRTTINRRIIRRMVLSKCKGLHAYATLLSENNAEVDVLCNDLLINVTTFFRDPHVFRALTKRLLPKLTATRAMNDPLRIWVAGCATGEEVVSIAITMLEHLGENAVTAPVQLFATDLNERSIERARSGIYKRHAVQGLSKARLERFFVQIDGHYQVIKAIRDMCVFARHDLLHDPPFSRMDLVSCQNVLIYLEPHAQNRVLRSFAFALKPDGFLLLGKSESIASAEDQFLQPDRDDKVYVKRGSATQHIDIGLPVPTPAVLPHAGPDVRAIARPRGQEFDLDRETDKLLLQRFAPASVVVNKELHIVRFRGPIADYLGPTTGKVSWSILKMVRDDLAFEVRSLLLRVQKDNMGAQRTGIPLDLRGTPHRVTVDVTPLVSAPEPYLLVIFRDEGRVGNAVAAAPATDAPATDAHGDRVRTLERELRESREQMRLLGEEADAITADLQAANEEVTSSNEELQSINEELETSKEELQSINEEFATANEELQRRNEDLHESEARFRELIRTMPVAVYTCDAQGHVRLFNQAAVALWGREPEPGKDVWCGSHRMFRPDGTSLPLDQCPMAVALKERRALRDVEAVVERPDGTRRYVLANPQPMFNGDGILTGAVNVLVDVTERRTAYEGSRRLAAIVESSDDAIISQDLQGRITSWNHAAELIYGYTAEEAIGRHISLLLNEDRKGEERAILERLLAGERIEHYETRRRRKDGGIVDVSLTLSLLRDADGNPSGAAKIARDITERLRIERERAEALRLIAETAERLRETTEVARLGSWTYDVQKRQATFDARCATMLGLEGTGTLPLEEVLALVDMRDSTHMQEAIGHALANDSDGRVETELRVRTAEGVQHWVRIAGKVVQGNGAPARFDGTLLDITRIKEAEDAIRASEERFHQLADSMQQLVWISAPDGRVTWLNRRWADFTGLPVRDLLNDTVRQQMHHPDHRERITAMVTEHIRRGLPWEFTFPFRHADGSYHWFLSRAVPVRDAEGTLLRWFGTNTDITDQKNAQDALAENDRRKDEFLATLAHELRNPLAPLRNGLQLLESAGEDAALVQETSGIMGRQVDQMVRLVDDLLDLSRINQGRIELRMAPMDLRIAAQQAMETVKPLIDQYGHTLVLDLPATPVMIDGDLTRLAQVIANLLNNAAKYTPAGGHITLSLNTADGRAMVQVKDDGIGIRADMLEKVFDMFAQVDPTKGNIGGGLGIGLNIVKRLVELHGGTVVATSPGMDLGSTFNIGLDLRNGSAPAALPLHETRSNGNRRVLVVDDNEDIVLSMSMLLRRLGHTVETAFNGKQAVMKAEEFRPEIVLMDIGMPEMNGYEAARRMREQPWGERIRIVAITGWGQEQDVRQAYDAGFDRHLVKPVDRTTLLGLLNGEPVQH